MGQVCEFVNCDNDKLAFSFGSELRATEKSVCVRARAPLNEITDPSNLQRGGFLCWQ